MSSEPAVSVRNISKLYDLGLSGRTSSFSDIIKERVRHPIRGNGSKRDLLHALDDVSFDVAQGEALGVIGKNGAGKSTLLKILSRITTPSSGSIEMSGTVGSLLEVGTGFHPELTGLENVYLNGTILGMSKRYIDRRLEEIIDFAEVDRFLDTPVKRYSSGMRVRLAFAVAAHLDPEILIVDEVLSVGDFAFQAKCLEKMRSVAADQGRTVLYVSHNLVTVEHLCPRALLLAGGRLVFDGPTNETMAQYLNMFPRAEQGSEPGVFDLSAADRSQNDYERLCTRLEIRPGGGAPADAVRMGDRLRLEIAVEGLDAIDEALVMVIVGTSSQPVLFRMTSQMVQLHAAGPRQSQETVVIDIPSLPLTAGEYDIAVQIKDASKTIDFVWPAARFTVLPADVLGNGYHFGAAGADDGLVVVPWEWEIRPTAPEGATAEAPTPRRKRAAQPARRPAAKKAAAKPGASKPGASKRA